jgi:hypothetical protein
MGQARVSGHWTVDMLSVLNLSGAVYTATCRFGLPINENQSVWCKNDFYVKADLILTDFVEHNCTGTLYSMSMLKKNYEKFGEMRARGLSLGHN